MGKGRPASYPAETRDQAIELRKRGLTNREVAEHLGLSTYQVEYIMRITRNVGQWYYYRPPQSNAAAIITHAIHQYGSVHIEDGLNDGYIATVADIHVGEECKTIVAAIRSAEAKAVAVEGWRFAG